MDESAKNILKQEFVSFVNNLIHSKTFKKDRNVNLLQMQNTFEFLSNQWNKIVDKNYDEILFLIDARNIIVVDVLNVIRLKKLDEIKDLSLDASPPPNLRSKYKSYLNSPINLYNYRIKANCIRQIEYLDKIARLMNKFGKNNNLYIFIYRQDPNLPESHPRYIPPDKRNCNVKTGFYPTGDDNSDSPLYWAFIIDGYPGSEADDIMVLFLTYLFDKYGSNVGIFSTDNYKWSKHFNDKHLKELFNNRITWRFIQLGDGTIIDVETLLTPKTRKAIEFLLD